MDHAVHSAVFAQFPHKASSFEQIWVVIICEDRSVHSFGVSSGRTHVIGLDTCPKSMIPCGDRGVIIACVEASNQLGVYILQGPEELLKAVVPSSVSSPLHAKDEIIYCDDYVSIVWNTKQRVVRAYAIRFLEHANKSTHLSMADTHRKGAVLSPIREWPQLAYGRVFGQTLRLANNESHLHLVASHDPERKALYVLSGGDLLRFEDIALVSPLAGVHNFPGVVTVSSTDLTTVAYSCLFSPQVSPLLIPPSGGNGTVKALNTDPNSNWIEIVYEPPNESSRVALAFSLDPVTSACFDVVLELLGPTYTAIWLAEFLVNKRQLIDEMKAFTATVANLAADIDAALMAKLIIYLHMLREELSLLTDTTTKSFEELTALLVPYISEWGPQWREAYNIENLGDTPFEETSASDPGIPCLLAIPLRVFEILKLSIDPSSTTALPEIAYNDKLYPTTTHLIQLFQAMTTCSGAEELRKFLAKHDYLIKNIDRLSPGIKTCLLEILTFVGETTYDEIVGLSEETPITTREYEHGTDDPESDTALISSQIIKGRFPHDLRFKEASRMLQAKSPQSCFFGIYFDPKNISEHKFARIQKKWGEELASRALATAYGRASIEINSQKPLLWEQIKAPSIDFSGECSETGISIPAIYKTLEAAADDNPWGVFAQGAALGLSISPSSPGIGSLWVITSAQLDSLSSDLYSGFVYGMGLSGHLAKLEDWQFYESLVNSNSRGTVAALLGVAASKRGSRDAKLTKVLSVHIKALLPAEAHDANFVTPEVERAALISMGLLYMGQGVRHLSEALHRELEWVPTQRDPNDGENSEHTEANKLAIGIALGLINLGWAKTSGVEHLVTLITGHHDQSMYAAEIASGALCTVLLAFVGSNDKILAAQIQLPRTRVAAAYSSPHIFFSRALAYHLILWDQVGTTETWIRESVPEELKLGSAQSTPTRVEKLWYYYSLAGVLTAVAFRHISSNDQTAVDALLNIIETEFYKTYLDVVMQLIEDCSIDNELESISRELNYDLAQSAKHFALLLSSLAISLGALAAGSGNLKILRFLRKLWQINAQVQATISEGQNLAWQEDIGLDLTCVAQAVGWLFMGSGRYAFKADPESVAFLATFSTLNVLGGFNVKASDWQHLRFLWSLTTEPRCLFAEKDPSEDVAVKILLSSGRILSGKLPLMLPPLPQVESVQVIDSRYTPQLYTRDELPHILKHGMNISLKEVEGSTLESMLPFSTKPRAGWDRVPIKALRATLIKMAQRPSSTVEADDLNFLLAFSEVWPVDSENCLLKRRDIEQLKFYLLNRTINP